MKLLYAITGVLAMLATLAIFHDMTSHDIKAGGLTIVQPFARASAGTRAGAVFMELHNRGTTADRLVSVTVPEDIAKTAQIHNHIMENDIARMREVEGGVEIPAGGMVMLKPGGLHLMLVKLPRPLEEGGRFMLTLMFEHGGEVTLEVPVLGIDAGTGEMMNGLMEDMDHMEHTTPSSGS